ncbi:MAG: GTP 3',8-cyclase MoaA [Oscillospiraceae bacterium]|jgi:cyclic pyranopterin phosphate synthase|nr:GTP 3',8-cyclase MoaA [Oscillospiraceae bacterium]
MKDGFAREIDYARISVTDRCNLRCVYCMPDCGAPRLSHGAVLRYEEIARLCAIFAQLGIRKLKLTGGEPLVRRGLPDLVRQLKKIRGIEQVTLTTNGALLSQQIDELVRAGIDAVNISIDTLDAQLYAQLTRGGSLDAALSGLHAALQYPDLPIKINCVPFSQDASDIANIAALARDYPLHVRFIEMMPIGLGKHFACRNEAEIIEILSRSFGQLLPEGTQLGNGPCHYFSLDGFQGKIGFISALSHKFCEDCNRIRLTANGMLKTCLQYESGCDLRELLRGSADDTSLREAICAEIAQKPACHRFHEDKPLPEERRAMWQIGG